MNLKKGLNAGNSVIVILGPTASGKSDLSLSLAKKLDGEIISADSMQVYKHMNIGTAKPAYKQRQETPHHLISIIEPDENFSAGEFKRRAEKTIERILNKKKIPIISGGTGLYIKAVTDGLCESPPEDKKTRKRLSLLVKKHGKKYLYNRLLKIDPETAAGIHQNNTRRIIRALEVYELTRAPISRWHKKMKKPAYDFRMFGLSWNRETLYGRINKRVDYMFEKGFVNEVKRLLIMGYAKNLRSMQSIGYKHIIDYFENKHDYQTLIELIKRDTRRFAKRQLTWWNKDTRIQWLDCQPPKKEQQQPVSLILESIRT